MKYFKTAAAAAIAALGLGAGTATAEWPEKPISYVVSFAAGGNADIIARMNAEVLSNSLGVPVNVINKPAARISRRR